MKIDFCSFSRTTITTKAILHACFLVSLVLFSTACSSKQNHELQKFHYKEAIRIFKDQQHNTPGVWTCSYSESSSIKTIEDTTSLMVEIDEKYIYIKRDNRLIELFLTTRNNETAAYNNNSENLYLRIKIIKRSNYSEYQESHDRIVEAELESSGRSYSFLLLGEACGI